MSLQEKLEALKETTLLKIKESPTMNDLNQIRVEVLGKKGPITEVLRGMKDLSAEERPKVGSYANEIRDILTEAIEEAKTSIEAANLEKALAEES
ncbi:phenylalanine--tRNA ligase subunit alpha, partial [Listeria monocytogenes]